MTALDLSRSTSGVYLTPEQSNEIWTGVSNSPPLPSSQPE